MLDSENIKPSIYFAIMYLKKIEELQRHLPEVT